MAAPGRRCRGPRQRDVQRIPLLRTRAGPRDEAWLTRLAEEYSALIKVPTGVQRRTRPLRAAPC